MVFRRKKGSPATAQNWRDLKQDVGRRPRTAYALRNKLLRVAKISIVVLSVASLSVLAWFGPKWYSERERPIDLTGPSQAVSRLEFASDGPLDARWFNEFIPIKQNLSLMELDIEQIRWDLEAVGQIESAEVRRVFPDLLRIKLKERRPCLKLYTQRPDGEKTRYFVSDDGFVFKPLKYKPTAFSSLPFYIPNPDGLVETDDGFEPIEGVAEVARLLDLARREYPTIYRDWEVVSFDRLGSAFEDDPGAHVLIRSRSGKVKRLCFGPVDFSGQMRRLKYLLHDPGIARTPQVDSINLSLGETVFVE